MDFYMTLGAFSIQVVIKITGTHESTLEDVQSEECRTLRRGEEEASGRR